MAKLFSSTKDKLQLIQIYGANHHARGRGRVFVIDSPVILSRFALNNSSQLTLDKCNN